MFDGFSPSPATVAVEPRHSPGTHQALRRATLCRPSAFSRRRVSLWRASQLAIGHGVCNSASSSRGSSSCACPDRARSGPTSPGLLRVLRLPAHLHPRLPPPHHNIYGNIWEDFAASLFMYPNVVSQLHYQSMEKTQNNDVYKRPPNRRRPTLNGQTEIRRSVRARVRVRPVARPSKRPQPRRQK